MITRLVHYKQLALAFGFSVVTVPAAVHGQSVPSPKLDESLRESVERGCGAPQSIIITVKSGHRQSVRDSLVAHGDLVTGDFPAIDAIAADVHCDDLAMLAAFDSTL